jgi:hypothetical protein
MSLSLRIILEGWSLNKQLKKLIESWKSSGSPEQEGFDWTSGKKNWIKAFPDESRLMDSLPDEIDRITVRKICNSKKHSVIQKFLAVMVWGYGDRGYGPYRVTQMLSQPHTEAILTQVYQICQSGKPLEAYDFLRKNRIRILGPSYGSKFITFCTPREVGAPIYDSLISFWVNEFAQSEFSQVSTSAENWNLKTYTRYWNWIKEHSDEFNCFPDEVELVLFRDAEKKFSKSSNWSGK